MIFFNIKINISVVIEGVHKSYVLSEKVLLLYYSKDAADDGLSRERVGFMSDSITKRLIKCLYLFMDYCVGVHKAYGSAVRTTTKWRNEVEFCEVIFGFLSVSVVSFQVCWLNFIKGTSMLICSQHSRGTSPPRQELKWQSNGGNWGPGKSVEKSGKDLRLTL